jgi:uncharacterized MAPEG superfamily protein
MPLTAAAPFVWSLVLAGAVVMLSLVPLALGRARADFSVADLAAPRAMFERLPAWGQRASWAHQNAFESFTLHAPACLLCLVAGVNAPAALIAAWAHPLLRLAYNGAYVANAPPLRSLCWIGGLLATAVLYSEGLKAALAAG